MAVVADGAASSTSGAYLAAAGVGRLAMVDQTAPATVGHTFTPPELETLNPDCAVRQLRPPQTSDETFALASQYDVVIVCEARSPLSAAATESTALLNAACLDLRKPLLWARVDGVAGCLTQVAGEQASAPCYQCLLPQLPHLDADTAPAPWAAALTAGVVGSVQATEALKIVLGIDETLAGRLVTWNGLGATMQERRVVRDARCTTCSATLAGGTA